MLASHLSRGLLRPALPLLCRCLLQGFDPTSNVRCGSMLKEATEFSHQLKKVEGAVRRMAAANAESVSRG